MPLLVAGTNGVMALKVAKLLDYPVCYSQLYRHPDGEKYFRFACDVEGEDVVIFNSMHPNPDEILFESILIAETALDAGASSVSVVFPYFAYARTTVGAKGEAVPIKTVARMLKSAGVRKVYAVDFHLDGKILGVEFEDITAMKLLAEYCVSNFDDELEVIAPDEHAVRWAKIFASELSSEIVVLKKIRIDAENVIVQPIDLTLSGSAVVVDDIVSTGATVCQAARIAKKAGCERVYVACTHAILAGDAMARMLESGIEDAVATDTILSPVSHVSVANLVAERLREDFS